MCITLLQSDDICGTIDARLAFDRIRKRHVVSGQHVTIKITRGQAMRYGLASSMPKGGSVRSDRDRAPASNVTWLTIEQLSDRLQIPVNTLRYWRSRSRGPRAVKLVPGQGGQIRYRLSEVERWEHDLEQAQAVSGAA
jgi:hypothetical protein